MDIGKLLSSKNPAGLAGRPITYSSSDRPDTPRFLPFAYNPFYLRIQNIPERAWYYYVCHSLDPQACICVLWVVDFRNYASKKSRCHVLRSEHNKLQHLLRDGICTCSAFDYDLETAGYPVSNATSSVGHRRVIQCGIHASFIYRLGAARCWGDVMFISSVARRHMTHVCHLYTTLHAKTTASPRATW